MGAGRLVCASSKCWRSASGFPCLSCFVTSSKRPVQPLSENLAAITRHISDGLQTLTDRFLCVRAAHLRAALNRATAMRLSEPLCAFVRLFVLSQAILQCAAHGPLKGTCVRHYKPLETNGIQEQNSHCASALYVPLLQYPVMTTAKHPTSWRSSTVRKRSLRLQESRD
jgi:hypothetical protein